MFSTTIKPGLEEIINSTLTDSQYDHAIWAEMHVTLAQDRACPEYFLYSPDLRISFLADFHVTVESGISKLVKMAVNRDDETVRVAGVRSLAALIHHGVLNSYLS